MERLNDKSKTKVLEVKVDESQLYIHGENFDIEKKLENLFIGNSKPGEYLEIVYTDSKERDPPTYRIFLKWLNLQTNYFWNSFMHGDPK